jgi:fibronectin-binding autotransporter adhesin
MNRRQVSDRRGLGMVNLVSRTAMASAVFVGLLAASADAALVSYWDFEDGTGATTAANLVTGGPVATLRNMDSNTAWVTGRSGTGLTFDGTNDYLTVVQNVSESTLTVSMWVKTTSDGGFFSVTEPEQGTDYDRNEWFTDGNIAARVYDEEKLYSSGTNYADGNWHHVVHQYGSNGHYLYVDGVLKASGTKTSSNFNWDTNLQIGWSNSPYGLYFTGQIDDVAIWEDQLSAGRVYALANGVTPTNLQSTAGTVAKWTAGTSAWDTATNWDVGVVPATGYDAYVNNGGTAQVATGVTANPDVLVVGGLGTGTVQLTGGTLSPGNMTLSPGGTLLYNSGTLSAGALHLNGGTFRTNVTMTTAQPFTLDSGGGTFDTQGYAITLTGVIDGSGDLTKTGSYALYLDGNNSFTGTAIVSQGYLVARRAGALGSTSGVTRVLSGGTLQLESNVTITGETAYIQGTGVGGTRGALGVWQDVNTWDGPVVMEGASTVFANSGTQLTVSGPISGDYVLTKTGTGTLMLSGTSANTSTGTTTLSDGKLILGKTAGVNAIAGDLVIAPSGGWANAATGVELAANEQIADTAAITFSGTDYSGFRTKGFTETVVGISSTGGKGVIENAGATQNVATNGKLIVNNSADFLFDGYFRDRDGTGSSTIALEKRGAGTLTLKGPYISYSGGTTIAGGKLVLQDTTAFASAIANSSALEFNVSSAVAYSAALTGAGTLAKTGGGTLTLSGSNITYTGATTVSAGTLLLQDTSKFASNITNSAAVEIAVSGGPQPFDKTISGTGSLTKSGSGMLVLYTPQTYGGATNITGGTLKLPETTLASGGSASLALHLDATTSSSLTTDGSGNVSEWRSLVGTDKVTPPAAGREPKLAAGAINGNTAVAFTAATKDALVTTTNFSAPVTVLYVGGLTGGSNLRLLSGVGNNWLLGYHGGGYDKAFFENWLYNPATTADTKTRLYSAVIPGSGQNSTVWSNGFQIVTGTAGTAGPNGLSLGGGYSGGEYSNGQIGELLVYTTALSDADRQAIERYLAAKWLYAAVDNYLPDDSAFTISAGATLDLSGRSETIGSLAGAGNVLLGEGTLTTGGNGAESTFSGTISGTGGLVKTGSGVFYVDGTNTYDGLTTVAGGWLVARNNGALGSAAGATRVLSGASFQLENKTGDVTITGETVYLNGDGMLGYRGALSSWSGNNTWAGPVVLESNSRVFVQADSLTVSGPLSGSFSLIKNGAGKLVLSAAGSSLGSTTVAEGTLLIDGSITSPVTVAGGTLGGNGSITGTVTLNSGTVSAGDSPGLLSITGAYVQNAGTMLAELGGLSPGVGGYDQIAVTGSAALAAGSTIDVNLVNGFVPATGDKFDILTTTTGITADLDSLTFDFSDASLAPAQYWIKSILGSSGGPQVLELTVGVPEPSTLLLAGLGLVGFVAFGRRRLVRRRSGR